MLCVYMCQLYVRGVYNMTCNVSVVCAIRFSHAGQLLIATISIVGMTASIVKGKVNGPITLGVVDVDC